MTSTVTLPIPSKLYLNSQNRPMMISGITTQNANTARMMKSSRGTENSRAPRRDTTNEISTLRRSTRLTPSMKRPKATLNPLGLVDASKSLWARDISSCAWASAALPDVV